MDLSFENKVAVVTGAASGMGLATAQAFAQAGEVIVGRKAAPATAASAMKRVFGMGTSVDSPCKLVASRNSN